MPSHIEQIGNNDYEIYYQFQQKVYCLSSKT